MRSPQECRQKSKENKPTLAAHRDAPVCSQVSRRHTLYLHLEPVYIHIPALFSPYLSPSTPLRLFSLARPFDRLFMSLHEDGLQGGGRRLRSLAPLLQFGYGCRAVIKSIKRRRFHTNYGKIMKPLVEGRMKVRLSLVQSEYNPSESICKVNGDYQKGRQLLSVGKSKSKAIYRLHWQYCLGTSSWRLFSILRSFLCSRKKKRKRNRGFFFFLAQRPR